MRGDRARESGDGCNLYKLPTSYVAIDIETTGLDFDNCDIIEIGAVRVSEGDIVSSFDRLVHIEYELDPFIVDLTGITDEMLQSASSLDNVVKEFSEFIGDSVLLAHNASFDMNFLRTAYINMFGGSLSNDYVDTLRVARKAFPDMRHRRLLDLCRALDVSNEHEHRALSDSVAVAECYQHMRSMVINKYGDEIQYAKSFKRGRKNNARARDIQETVEEIDDSNPLYGMRCVFTGKLTSMVRKEAIQKLKNVGGVPKDNVTQDTDYLILGNDGFSDALKTASGKINHAKNNQLKGLPIQIISENVFLQMLKA